MTKLLKNNFIEINPSWWDFLYFKDGFLVFKDSVRYSNGDILFEWAQKIDTIWKFFIKNWDEVYWRQWLITEGWKPFINHMGNDVFEISIPSINKTESSYFTSEWEFLFSTETLANTLGLRTYKNMNVYPLLPNNANYWVTEEGKWLFMVEYLDETNNKKLSLFHWDEHLITNDYPDWFRKPSILFNLTEDWNYLVSKRFSDWMKNVGSLSLKTFKVNKIPYKENTSVEYMINWIFLRKRKEDNKNSVELISESGEVLLGPADSININEDMVTITNWNKRFYLNIKDISYEEVEFTDLSNWFVAIGNEVFKNYSNISGWELVGTDKWSELEINGKILKKNLILKKLR